MFRAISQFFAMFASLFSAGEKLANGLNHAAAFVEGESAAFNERASLSRTQELKKLRSQYSLEDRQMAAAEAVSARDLDKTLRENAIEVAVAETPAKTK